MMNDEWEENVIELDVMDTWIGTMMMRLVRVRGLGMRNGWMRGMRRVKSTTAIESKLPMWFKWILLDWTHAVVLRRTS